MNSGVYDVAVLGVGSMGSFACLELARRGLRVIGLDRFHPPHAFGSHSGETRVYREAYAENPDYVPVALLAGRLWEQFGAEAGQPLLTRCGSISVGTPDSLLISGLRRSAAMYGICVTVFEHDRLRAAFPMIHAAEEEIGVLEPGAGWVNVDTALSFALAAVREAGGELRLGSEVLGWNADPDGVMLTLQGEHIRARRLIVCAGAWAPQVLSDLHLPLRVVRKVLVWLRPRDEFARAAQTMPVTGFAERFFYSFPAKDGLFKVAIHWSEKEQLVSPEAVAPATEQEIDDAVREAVLHLGPLFGDVAEARTRVAFAKTCLYTMTPDEHFIVDRVPDRPVTYAAGFSGHGFKFAPAIGRVLAQLSLGEAPEVPIAFLRASRFAETAVQEHATER